MILDKYDKIVIDKLDSLFYQGEGCSFNGFVTENGMEQQTSFKEKVLQEVKPEYILETGTHKAMFCYLAKVNIPNVKIHTFGIDEGSQLCVDYLNNYFNEPYIRFHLGDTKKTLSLFRFNDKYSHAWHGVQRFDLAWVDGDHSKEGSILDLMNCARLGIKNIMVDDTNMIDVRITTLEYFLNERFVYEDSIVRYVLKGISEDERQVAWLQMEKVL